MIVIGIGKCSVLIIFPTNSHSPAYDTALCWQVSMCTSKPALHSREGIGQCWSVRCCLHWPAALTAASVSGTTWTEAAWGHSMWAWSWPAGRPSLDGAYRAAKEAHGCLDELCWPCAVLTIRSVFVVVGHSTCSSCDCECVNILRVIMGEWIWLVQFCESKSVLLLYYWYWTDF